jgi:hypothetical protein
MACRSGIRTRCHSTEQLSLTTHDHRSACLALCVSSLQFSQQHTWPNTAMRAVGSVYVALLAQELVYIEYVCCCSNRQLL